MKKIILFLTFLMFLMFLMFPKVLFSQTIEHRIEITYNLYATGFENAEYLYHTEKIPVKNSKKIELLISELNSIKNIDNAFVETKIDTLKILNNPLSLIKTYKNKNIVWNQQQTDFITEKLRNLETYKNNFEKLLNNGCCVHMHQRYRDEYVIEIYNKNNKLINTFSSRKSLPNTFKIPWRNNNNVNFNIKIDKIFFEIINSPESTKKLPNKTQLTKYLVAEIIDFYKPTLYDLSAYDYIDELDELKSDFEILKIGEFFGRGRYIDYPQRTFYARLSNSKMPPNVNIMFSATEERKTIYSRNHIKNDYESILNRVQNIEFITNYLKQNPSTQLDIYYFNDKPINDYNIDSFNKNPIEWKKQDEYIESLKWYEKNNIEPSFNIDEALKNSERLHCGCNYRFEKEFADQAIFIELKDKISKENSVWYLLPDNTVLLYIMQGEKVLDYNYSEFGKSRGLQYPCVLFDLKGNIIGKK